MFVFVQVVGFASFLMGYGIVVLFFDGISPEIVNSVKEYLRGAPRFCTLLYYIFRRFSLPPPPFLPTSIRQPKTVFKNDSHRRFFFLSWFLALLASPRESFNERKDPPQGKSIDSFRGHNTTKFTKT